MTATVAASYPWAAGVARVDRAACPRCGIVRHVDRRRGTRLCRDCRAVEPQWGEEE